MRGHRRRRGEQLVAAVVSTVIPLIGFFSPPAAWAQSLNAIKIVVPLPPGGPTDTMARLLAEQISREQGITTLIENRPGAGTVIGTETVARSAPDGSSVLVVANSFVIQPHLKTLAYDPLTSFVPICMLVRSPHYVVVNSASPYRTLADLRNAAIAKPGELTLATVGPATGPHIVFEMLKRALGVDMTFVPYPGTAPSINALLGGHVTAAIGDYRDVIGAVQGGKLRALVTPSAKRIEGLPDVPTMIESGYPEFVAEGWFGMVMPVKTAAETVSRLSGWLTAAMQAPDVKAKLVSNGLFPAATCGAEFGAHLRQQYEQYGRIIRKAKIKP